MRTTLDIPESLMQEAMRLTHVRTKTELIKIALTNLIRRQKIQGLKDYFGRVDLEIDLNTLRDR